jgi:hypothetical protein
MRRYFLLIVVLILAASCSRLDFDTSVQVQTWLESLDPGAKVIEVWCKADVKDGGRWVKDGFTNTLSASEVLEAISHRGLEWPDIVTAMIDNGRRKFPAWLFESQMEGTVFSREQQTRFVANLTYKNVRCNGKALRAPPITIPKCPNATNGCDELPGPLDPAPLPPPPPPGVPGDF